MRNTNRTAPMPQARQTRPLVTRPAARHRAALAALSAAAILLAGAPTAANVFAADGRDPRQWVTPDGSDARLLRAMATITAEFALRDRRGIGTVAPGQGTAFLVSPCYAITSYHVLFGARALTLDPMAAYRVSLRFGGDAGGPALLVKGRARFWGAAAGSAPDVALVLLDRCPGRQRGWFDLAAAPDASGTPVTMPSFSHDRSMRRLSVQHDCRIHAALPARGWLLHDCASREGASGAPLLAHGPGVPTVIGINAGELDATAAIQLSYTPARANWAVSTTRLLATARLVGPLARDRAGAVNPLAHPLIDRR